MFCIILIIDDIYPNLMRSRDGEKKNEAGEEEEENQVIDSQE